jgi:hypothetical protein
MSDYHEPTNELTPMGRCFVRALNSVKEEIEAIAWYHQRVEASTDQHLSNIMAHNRDEEIEHAVMGLEWLRRNMPAWDEAMREYLFTEGDVTQIEEQATGNSQDNNGSAAQNSSDLGIHKINK